jgi:hypothetical protein
MRIISACLLTFVFSFSALAQPYTQLGLSPASVMDKYDYILTAHPQAHESEFQKENIKKYKEELQKSLKESSLEDIKDTLEQVVAKIPQEAKREAYTKILNNSSQKQLLKFISSPELMQSALVGESANFSLYRDEPLIAVTHILITGLLLFVIIDTIVKSKRPTYRSYPVKVEGLTYCSKSTFNQYVSSAERENMKQDAKEKCKTQSPRPDTCKSDGILYHLELYSLTTNSGQTYNSNEGSCIGFASYTSKK